MERDPFRFAWRAAPGLNCALVVLVLLVGLPCLLVVLDLLRAAVDMAGPPRRTADILILRYTVDLPVRISATPLVLLPGFPLSAATLSRGVAIGLGGVLAAVMGLWWITGALAVRIGGEVAGELTDRLSDAIASAPVAAMDEARLAAALAGDALSQERRFLGSLAAAPIVLWSIAAFGVIHVGAQAIEMGLALLVGLVLYGFLSHRQVAHLASLALTGQTASLVLQRALAGLARHLSAVVAHGTGLAEKERIAADLVQAQLPLDRVERSANVGGAMLAGSLLVGPFAVLSLAAYPSLTWSLSDGVLSAGETASAFMAACFATIAVARGSIWTLRTARIGPLFSDIARAVGSLHAWRRTHDGVALPAHGILLAADVATASAAGGRLIHADLSLRLPAHIALAGSRDSGARTFASAVGGQTLLKSGRLTFGGVDLSTADPVSQAHRLAFAGGETYLFRGSLRTNLLYGAEREEPSGLEERLASAITVAGLDALIERRGLSGVIDPRREPRLQEGIVAARRAIQAALAAQGKEELVAPFDAARYNLHATIGENILFGIAIGDTFREDRLASQPFLRNLLEAEDLAKPLAAMGVSIARATLDMFGDLPDEPSLIGRFALIAPRDREAFEQLLQRREAGRRHAAASRDADALVGLALRYCEPRHRLGLLGEELRDRVVRLRAAFAEKIPKSLESTVEFLHPDRICAAASVRDNLLFGRIALDQARAERRVFAVVREVLSETGLRPDVAHVGLSALIDPLDPEMSAAEIAAIDIVRCLVRNPDTIVAEHVLDQLSESDAVAFVTRLTAALAGRGLLLVVPDGHAGAILPLFDGVVTFAGGRIRQTTPDGGREGPGEPDGAARQDPSRVPARASSEAPVAASVDHG